MSPVNIDTLYLAFVETLPPDEQRVARQLPYRLKLVASEDTSWSDVFRHEFTLSAPAFFAEALPGAAPGQIRDAVLAHMLGVVEFLVSTRLAGEEASNDEELQLLSERLSHACERLFERFGAGSRMSYEMACAKTQTASRHTRQLLDRVEPVSLSRYRSRVLAQHSARFSATLALAQVAGASPTEIRAVDRTLGSAWLALQSEEDALDWEHQWQSGGAWAVCVARGLRSATRDRDRPTEPDMLRHAVVASGALTALLGVSRTAFRATRRRACALRAERLAAWATEREQQLYDLVKRERESGGYAVRASRPSCWPLAGHS
jgi:hypothetical protein